MNPNHRARVAQLEASVAFRRWQASQRLVAVPDDPAELRRRYAELVSGPPDPALEELSAHELVDRFRRLVGSSRGGAQA